uniref:Uncharacterized protein n=1 Tax=Arundo donax TaxID=35708 RepID=A0A0A8ZMZ5_ARUDO
MDFHEALIYAEKCAYISAVVVLWIYF